MRRLLPALLLLAALPAYAQADSQSRPTSSETQPVAPLPWPEPAPVPVLSEEAIASVLTMVPGEEVYSLFGHTAVRVSDPALGLDRTYNYGVFDFDQPYFLLRFLRGRTDYQLATATFDRTVAEYRFLDRPVIEQRLALARADLQNLFLYLETNHLPQKRVYRYDFLFDNCSTRPRDALEWVLGERLSFGAYSPTPGTFRELIRLYTVAAPLADFGIELGFGRPVDRAPTPRETMFLPYGLFDGLEAATLDGRPLVAATDTLFWIPDAGMPDPAPDYIAVLATLLLLLGIGVTLWPAALPGARTALDIAILAFAGLLGVVLVLLWLATEHHVTRFNVDLLWAWPTHLVAAVVLGRAALGNRRAAVDAAEGRTAEDGGRRAEGRGRTAEGRTVVRPYMALAAAAAGTAGLLGLIGLLALHQAAVALALLVALRCADRAREA